MSLRPGRTDRDSGRTKLERVRQFGCTDRAFGHKIEALASN